MWLVLVRRDFLLKVDMYVTIEAQGFNNFTIVSHQAAANGTNGFKKAYFNEQMDEQKVVAT